MAANKIVVSAINTTDAIYANVTKLASELASTVSLSFHGIETGFVG